MKKWKTLSSELVFDNKWFKVQKDAVELSNGTVLDDYFFWKEQNVSQVVALTKNNKMVLVKQYKHAADEIMIEFPAGYVEGSEDFKEAAKREFLEETGYTAENFELIGKVIHNPTKSSGIVKIYLALGAEMSDVQNLDQNEEIEILVLEIDKVLKMISKGEIWATGTIAAIFLALNKLKYNL